MKCGKWQLPCAMWQDVDNIPQVKKSMCNPDKVKKLVLGTAQFGLPYGIANAHGQVSAEEARAILERAENIGIDMLDTAIAYGESEICLGMVGVSRWKVVSKLPAVPEHCIDIESWAFKSVDASLERLRIPRLHGFLLHRSDQLLGHDGEALYRALANLKEQGLVEKTGISIYDPMELDTLTERFSFDIIQAPFNILDNRMNESDWMGRLSRQGTEVHVRSIFLQGLLLMPASLRPERFSRWKPLWSQLELWFSETGITPLEACLRHALSQQQADRVIVGVDSLNHLKGILRAADGAAPKVPNELHCNDLDLINPSRWSAIQ